MRRAVLSTLILAALVVVATFVIGWPAPAVVGALAAVIAFGPRQLDVLPRQVAGAAALGWGALLLWSMLRGNPSAIVGLLGGLAGVHGRAAVGVTGAVALLTLGLGALLAWAAATCARGLLAAAGIGPGSGARAASAPRRITLSTTADVAPARDPERAPAAQTP